MECAVCKTNVTAETAAWTKVIQGDEWALCRVCRDAAPGEDPFKIVEAFLGQFADEAGGPDDDRDHEDFAIGEALVAAGRIKPYMAPFGEYYILRGGKIVTVGGDEAEA